jgi:hypothetical protein
MTMHGMNSKNILLYSFAVKALNYRIMSAGISDGRIFSPQWLDNPLGA